MPKRENGQGTITHLKSGKYRAKIMIEGKEYTKTKSSEQDAKKALKEMIRNQKDLSKNKKYTVEEHINDWLISKKGSIRGKSFDTEEGNCKKINGEERTVSIKHSITLMKNREDKDHRKFVLE